MSPGTRAMPALTVVVVTYQSARTLGATLAAVRRCVDAGLMHCVIVDNGSDDGTIEQLEAVRSWAEVVFTGRNNGFGRACNIGLERVCTPYAVFVNPDAVVEPQAMKTLLEFIDTRPRVGVVGPAIINGEDGTPGTWQMAGARPTPADHLRIALRLAPRAAQRPIEPGAAPWRSGWVCGGVFMVRTELMRSIGAFDPRFFLYWEETDVCRRTELAGYEIWAVGEAVAHHVGGASSSHDDTRIGGCIARHYYQSRFYYMAKHHGWCKAALADTVEFAATGLRAAVDVVRGRGWSRLKPRLKAPLFSQPDRVA